ncbi:MAG: hypothetical protein ACJA1C_000788 [Crocinitomicaceae bacterium]|jgi:hypothetical protein
MTNEEIEKLYNDHTKELLNKTPIPENDIFPFIEGSPLDYEIKKAFKFYYSEIKKNIGCDLEPSYIFIGSDRTINAFAAKYKEVNIIGINVGTIRHLYDIFRINENLKSTLQSRFLKFPASDLMFETAMNYTFYHELGHLIQKASFSGNKLTEDVGNYFSLRSHVSEFDADEFSSILIAGHVAQFSIKNLGDKFSQIDLEDVLITVSTAILFYLLSFPSSQSEIYYDEYTHPHPTVRIANIMFVVITHCLSTLKTYGVNTDIDPDKIVYETMQIAELINDNFFDNSRLATMRNSIKDNVTEIEDYIAFLKDQKKGDKSMATFKWNLYAKSILDSKNIKHNT